MREVYETMCTYQLHTDVRNVVSRDIWSGCRLTSVWRKNDGDDQSKTSRTIIVITLRYCTVL